MVRLCQDIGRVHDTLHVVPVTEAVLARAEDAFPTVVGSVDAIPLASALAVRETLGLDRLLTHDPQLAAVARSLGSEVDGA